MITGLDLIACTVSDVQVSLAYYRDTLGLTPSATYEQGAEFELSDGATLGIWNPGDGSYPVGFGVMFAVADARAASELFRARGATIADAFESPTCVMAVGQDPDGNQFIVHQRKSKDDPTPAPHVKTATSVNGIDWAGYLVSDAARALAFYRDVLGLTPTYVYESGRGGEFTLSDGSTFGVWESTDGKGGAFMLAVADANATVIQLRERGVKISDAEDHGDCWMAHAADPDGIGVIVHQRTTS
jgi:predicted enzyme related to lactoylglutathione lyase